MAVIRMDMSSYEIERRGGGIEGDCDGMMEFDWSPALQLQPSVVAGRSGVMPADLVEQDVECFLRRMYVSQR
jgi:hypothetical protein